MGTRVEELKTLVDDIWKATETLADAEGSLRADAFRLLLERELMSGRATEEGASSQQANRGVPGSPTKSLPLDQSYATPEQRAEAIAQYFRIDQEAATELFTLTERDPALRIPRNRLSNSTLEAAREVALLICGARTALGRVTGTRDIEVSAEQYGEYDRLNFVSLLTDMEELSVRGKQASPNRLVRMRVTGARAARALAQRLVSNGG